MHNDRTILIKNANAWTDGKFQEADILISREKVIGISRHISTDDIPGIEVLNAGGKHVVTGLVDLHVHFREPGYSYKETIKDGSRAAAAGGFTTVCTMPNLNPAPDSMENLQKQLDIICKDAVIDVIPYATITKLRMGHEPVDYAALAPFVAGFSDDGTGVQDEEVMRNAMKGIAPTGKVLAAHCEVEALLNKGYIHDGEYAKAHGHRGICSGSEWKEIERDIRLAEETHCRLHVCHISTKESVELIRQAKKRGVPVTCETGPHYLTFCDKDLKEEGRFKMNPPIRSEADRDALRQGIIDGTIDAIATDHAPHSAEEKAKGLERSAMGVVGLETSFAAVYTTMVKTGMISLEKLVQVMSANPRRILGLQGVNGISVGMPADITILDTEKEWTVNPDEFLSKGKATPYDGMTLRGKGATTIFRGKVICL